MHHSAGHRIARYLLTVLAIASPLLAYGGDGKLAPVVDLNPRHAEAASHSLREPNALIVEAEAVPLLTDEGPSLAGRTAARQTTLQPAVRFVAPFDPTKKAVSQQNVSAMKPPTDVARLAPVIRVYQPIRETPRATIPDAPLPAENIRATDELVSKPSVIPESVHRSVFLATRTDRLQRTNTSNAGPVHRPDVLSARMLATLDAFTSTKPAPASVNSILPPTESVEQSTDLNGLHLSGFIQFAEGDPVAGKSDVKKSGLSNAARRPSPVVALANNPIIHQTPAEAPAQDVN
ncbi:MAG: hypothetical protein HYV60_23020 [Planctomycetia bacterium]|nr:hypothetical protein [Planctomycetia bacterium]